MAVTVDTTTIHPLTRRLRITGALVACSAPVTGLVAYALAAAAISEGRLEGSGGPTTTGWLVMATPLLVGAAMFVASFFGARLPGNRAMGFWLAGLTATLLAFGGYAMLTSEPGDASIGGGLLLLAAIPSMIVAGLLLRSNTSRPLPPPPVAPGT